MKRVVDCLRRCRLLIIVSVLIPVPASARAQDAGDHEAVRAAVRDYVEGFYQGDSTRFMRSVSPSVHKYGYSRAQDGTYSGMQMTYEGFMESARGVLAEGETAPPDALREIVIFDVQDQTASAKVTAMWGVDYLLLARIEGRWMVRQVLWQTSPAKPSSGAETLRPRPRLHHAITYDPTSRQVLVFGGFHGDHETQPRALQDLWGWDGSRWSLISAESGTGVMGHALFADDAGRVFAVGGRGWTGEWKAGSWRTVSTDSNRVRAGAAGAYDVKRGRFVLFGGSSAPRTLSGETWEFDGSQWTLAARGGPSPRMGSAMAWHAGLERVVLFGGRDTAAQLADTWTWDGRAWELHASTGPPARVFAGMAYDARRDEVVLLSGDRTSLQTWLWNGRTWRRADVSSPPPRAEIFMAYDADRAVTVLFGGSDSSGPRGDTWEWNGQRWTEVDTRSTRAM